jgi:hypothetical protein
MNRSSENALDLTTAADAAALKPKKESGKDW